MNTLGIEKLLCPKYFYCYLCKFVKFENGLFYWTDLIQYGGLIHRTSADTLTLFKKMTNKGNI